MYTPSTPGIVSASDVSIACSRGVRDRRAHEHDVGSPSTARSSKYFAPPRRIAGPPGARRRCRGSSRTWSSLPPGSASGRTTPGGAGAGAIYPWPPGRPDERRLRPGPVHEPGDVGHDLGPPLVRVEEAGLEVGPGAEPEQRDAVDLRRRGRERVDGPRAGDSRRGRCGDAVRGARAAPVQWATNSAWVVPGRRRINDTIATCAVGGSRPRDPLLDPPRPHRGARRGRFGRVDHERVERRAGCVRALILQRAAIGRGPGRSRPAWPPRPRRPSARTGPYRAAGRSVGAAWTRPCHRGRAERHHEPAAQPTRAGHARGARTRRHRVRRCRCDGRAHARAQPRPPRSTSSSRHTRSATKPCWTPGRGTILYPTVGLGPTSATACTTSWSWQPAA